MDRDTRTALVVGAGIAGLATAGALARTGWKVTLVEREDRIRPGRAALTLWPNGVRALQALGLGGGLDGIASPVPAGGIRRPDGQWLVQPERASVLTGRDLPVVVRCEDLHDAFVAGLGDQVDIRTGIQIRTARPSPERPAVSDGRVTLEADLVVGADGIGSVIRRRLASASIFVSTGSASWCAVIPWFRAPQLPPDVSLNGETLGVAHRFVHTVLGERASAGATSRGGIYWIATAPGAPRPESSETQLGLLRRWFAGWPAPIGELLAATEPEDLVQRGVGELRPLPASFDFPIGTGGYALVGDAAHAMTHHLGQGASLALEDASTLQAVLVHSIPGKSLAGGLDEYSRRRRPRVAKVLAQSRRIGSMFQARGRVAVRARDMAMARLLPRLLDRAATEASEWQPPAG